MRKEYYYTIKEKKKNKLIALLEQYKFDNSKVVIQDPENFTVQKISYKKFIFKYIFFICRWNVDVWKNIFETSKSYIISTNNDNDKMSKYVNELYELIDDSKNAQK